MPDVVAAHFVNSLDTPPSPMVRVLQKAGELPDMIVGLVLVGWHLSDGDKWIPQLYNEGSALTHWSSGRKVRPVWAFPSPQEQR